MARIRTIKPEFAHSESMGRVSRDSRLCFIMLWTLADDSGRLRGNSRMLASLLFPYDDDASKHIDKWLGELERESCLVRYEVDGHNYIQICNWLIHQKIDKPSNSKIPACDESSIKFANIREDSSLDQGPRTKDQGEDHSMSGKPDEAKELLEFLNKVTGKNFRPVEANMKLIKARLREYEIAELKAMVANQATQWKYDGDRSQYLRPATLFNATKCAQYVGVLENEN